MIFKNESDARAYRNKQLFLTDYTMVSDYPATPEAIEAMKEWRQKMRDLPSSPTFLNSDTWPPKPDI